MAYEFLIPIGFVVVFVTIVILAVIAEKKRNELFSSFAQRRGFQYEKKGDKNYLDIFSLGGIGHTKIAKRMIKGRSRGKRIEIFDYSYTVGGGRSSRTIVQTVLKTSLEKPLPDFTLWVKRWDLMFHKPKLPEVKMPDSNIYAFYGSPEVMEVMNHKIFPYLASIKYTPNIEVRNNQLIVYQISKKSKDLHTFLENAKKVVSLLE